MQEADELEKSRRTPTKVFDSLKNNRESGNLPGFFSDLLELNDLGAISGPKIKALLEHLGHDEGIWHTIHQNLDSMNKAGDRQGVLSNITVARLLGLDQRPNIVKLLNYLSVKYTTLPETDYTSLVEKAPTALEEPADLQNNGSSLIVREKSRETEQLLHELAEVCKKQHAISLREDIPAQTEQDALEWAQKALDKQKKKIYEDLNNILRLQGADRWVDTSEDINRETELLSFSVVQSLNARKIYSREDFDSLAEWMQILYRAASDPIKQALNHIIETLRSPTTYSTDASVWDNLEFEAIGMDLNKYVEAVNNEKRTSEQFSDLVSKTAATTNSLISAFIEMNRAKAVSTRIENERCKRLVNYRYELARKARLKLNVQNQESLVLEEIVPKKETSSPQTKEDIDALLTPLDPDMFKAVQVVFSKAEVEEQERIRKLLNKSPFACTMAELKEQSHILRQLAQVLREENKQFTDYRTDIRLPAVGLAARLLLKNWERMEKNFRGKTEGEIISLIEKGKTRDKTAIGILREIANFLDEKGDTAGLTHFGNLLSTALTPPEEIPEVTKESHEQSDRLSKETLLKVEQAITDLMAQGKTREEAIAELKKIGQTGN